MAVEARRVWLALVAATFGCASTSAPQPVAGARPTFAPDRLAWPLRPCGSALYPERIGVWQGARRERAVIYDGCSVRLVALFENDPAPFRGMRNVARAFNVDARVYGDPYPVFRTAARWDGPRLWSISIIGERYAGMWAEERFWYEIGVLTPLFRARTEAELGASARELLQAEAFTPTEEELAARRGVPMPPPDAPPVDYYEQMFCPAGCDAPAGSLDELPRVERGSAQENEP